MVVREYARRLKLKNNFRGDADTCHQQQLLPEPGKSHLLSRHLPEFLFGEHVVEFLLQVLFVSDHLLHFRQGVYRVGTTSHQHNPNNQSQYTP